MFFLSAFIHGVIFQSDIVTSRKGAKSVMGVMGWSRPPPQKVATFMRSLILSTKSVVSLVFDPLDRLGQMKFYLNCLVRIWRSVKHFCVR